jgi:hypothetical protein
MGSISQIPKLLHATCHLVHVQNYHRRVERAGFLGVSTYGRDDSFVGKMGTQYM